MQTPPPIDDFDLIVFGGNGDLALRKLMPALFELELDDRLPAGARIFAVARTETERAAYIHHVAESCKKQVGADRFDAARWKAAMPSKATRSS